MKRIKRNKNLYIKIFRSKLIEVLPFIVVILSLIILCYVGGIVTRGM